MVSITAEGNSELAQLECSSGVVAAEGGSKATAACPACMDSVGESQVNDRGEVAVPKLDEGPNTKAPPPSSSSAAAVDAVLLYVCSAVLNRCGSAKG